MVGKLFKVLFTRKAHRKLDQITGYYEKEVSVSVANKIRKKILDSSEELEKLPESKPILEGTENFTPKVRYAKGWSFKIIFSVFKKREEVTVLDIRHDKENPKDIIDEL